MAVPRTKTVLLPVIGGGGSRDGMGEGAGMDGAGVSPAQERLFLVAVMV